MIKIILFIFPLVSVIAISCSQRERMPVNPENTVSPATATSVQGAVSGNISLEKSPYFVKGNLIIDPGSTLVIEPGVRFFFADSARLIVRGNLSAVGTNGRPIFFAAYDQRWKGIRVLGKSAQATFCYCAIQQVYLDDVDNSNEGALETEGGNVRMENCVLRRNFTMNGGGIALFDASAIVKNNILRDNIAVSFGGAMIAQNSTVSIINNTFYGNYCENYGAGVVLFDSISTNIQNNIFYRNNSNLGKPDIYQGNKSRISGPIQYNFLNGQEIDPGFISSDDLHLSANSPCKNAGNAADEFKDTDGSPADQGAFGGPSGNWTEPPEPDRSLTISQ